MPTHAQPEMPQLQCTLVDRRGRSIERTYIGTDLPFAVVAPMPDGTDVQFVYTLHRDKSGRALYREQAVQ